LLRPSTRIASPIISRPLASFAIKGIHEPEYLTYLKPQIPFYDKVNIQIRGYDFAVLDSYSRYLHRLSNKLGLNVSAFWAAANTSRKVEILKHESTITVDSHELNLYERNVQLQNITGRLLALVIEIVHRSLPVGVYLSIHEHSHLEHEASRYIVDHQLLEHKDDLKLLMASKQKDEEDLTAAPGKKKK